MDACDFEDGSPRGVTLARRFLVEWLPGVFVALTPDLLLARLRGRPLRCGDTMRMGDTTARCGDTMSVRMGRGRGRLRR